MLFIIITIICLNMNFYSSSSICHHDLIEKDVVALSTVKQLSGRIAYKEDTSDKKDMVPNETLAVKIALLLLESFYGKNIYNEKPFRVVLSDSVWIIETSLTSSSQNIDSSRVNHDIERVKITCGGVGHVEINKHTGEIYSVYHTK